MKIEDIRPLIPQICREIVAAGGIDKVILNQVSDQAIIDAVTAAHKIKCSNVVVSAEETLHLVDVGSIEKSDWVLEALRYRLNQLVKQKKLGSGREVGQTWIEVAYKPKDQ